MMRWWTCRSFPYLLFQHCLVRLAINCSAVFKMLIVYTLIQVLRFWWSGDNEEFSSASSSFSK